MYVPARRRSDAFVGRTTRGQSEGRGSPGSAGLQRVAQYGGCRYGQHANDIETRVAIGQGLASPASSDRKIGMTAQRWQQVKRLFDEAVERDPVSRAEFLRQSCGPDEELLEQVEALLASDG